jgi:hypothetical protein
MQTWIVWTKEPVTDDALRQFAEGEGGYWNDAIGGEAVIGGGDLNAFVAAAMTTDESNVMPEDVVRASAVMNRTPASMVSITFRYGEESSEIAELIAQHVIDRWGGFLDRNAPDGVVVDDDRSK